MNTIIRELVNEIKINLGLAENSEPVKQLESMNVKQLEFLAKHYCKYTESVYK